MDPGCSLGECRRDVSFQHMLLCIMFQFGFNSFLELPVRILEAKGKKLGEFLLMVCALPKQPSNLVNKITSPVT